MKRLGPYSKASRVAHSDGRSSTARFLRRERDAILKAIKDPTPSQIIVVDALVEIRLRIHMLNEKYRETGIMTDHDRNTYLAWQNAATRLAFRLDLRDRSPKPDLSVADAIAAALGRAA